MTLEPQDKIAIADAWARIRDALEATDSKLAADCTLPPKTESERQRVAVALERALPPTSPVLQSSPDRKSDVDMLSMAVETLGVSTVRHICTEDRISFPEIAFAAGGRLVPAFSAAQIQDMTSAYARLERYLHTHPSAAHRIGSDRGAAAILEGVLNGLRQINAANQHNAVSGRSSTIVRLYRWVLQITDGIPIRGLATRRADLRFGMASCQHTDGRSIVAAHNFYELYEANPNGEKEALFNSARALNNHLTAWTTSPEAFAVEIRAGKLLVDHPVLRAADACINRWHDVIAAVGAGYSRDGVSSTQLLRYAIDTRRVIASSLAGRALNHGFEDVRTAHGIDSQQWARAWHAWLARTLRPPDRP